jgi:hypothetical protein
MKRSLLLGILLPAALIPLHAELHLDDAVVTGPLPTQEAPKNSPLCTWSEEVTYSAPVSGPVQTTGTTLSNAILMSPDGVWSMTSRVVAQPFSIPEDGTDQMLEKIFIPVLVDLRGKSPLPLRARLVDLGSSPSLEEYEAGTNLLTEPAELAFSTASERDSGQIASITFSGNDRIRLKKGHTYSFELLLDPENPPKKAPQPALTWMRGLRVNKGFCDMPAFYVPYTEQTSHTSTRTAIKDRQAFMGVKTSPAQ